VGEKGQELAQGVEDDAEAHVESDVGVEGTKDTGSDTNGLGVAVLVRVAGCFKVDGGEKGF
jgi:hypothetical protein